MPLTEPPRGTVTRFTAESSTDNTPLDVDEYIVQLDYEGTEIRTVPATALAIALAERDEARRWAKAWRRIAKLYSKQFDPFALGGYWQRWRLRSRRERIERNLRRLGGTPRC